MNSYAFAPQWSEGQVRDTISAIVHRDPTLGPLVGSKRIEVILHPSVATFPDDHDVITEPARATLLVDGREGSRRDKARQAVAELLDSVARASGMRATDAPEDAGASGFGVLWRQPQSVQDAELAKAIIAMRAERDGEIVSGFRARWCAAA